MPFILQGIPQLPCAKALYNYDGKEPGDLKFSKGDIIILRRQVDENWFHGEMGGVHGFFPTNFVQVIKPLPQPPPQCKALYDFELKDKEADKDCLPFSKVTRPQEMVHSKAKIHLFSWHWCFWRNGLYCEWGKTVIKMETCGPKPRLPYLLTA